MSIAIVTDSTADIPPDLAAKHNITVVPLTVRFGSEEFKDGVTIKSDEFYRRLQSSNEFPTTSQPSVGEFLETYRRLAETSDAIISLHVSAKVSGTFNSAVQAQHELASAANCRIEVIDTQQVSGALGLIALGVARAVEEGASIGAALSKAQDLASRARFYGMLSTLEYLQKGGRIGRAQAFIGGLLKVTPIITFENGETHPFDRPRTQRRGVARLRELTAEAMPLESLCVLYTTEADLAQQLADEVAEYAPGKDVLLAQIGSVIGTYAGPGTLGVGFISARKP